ncbi:MAG: dihydropyrimidinase [Candidatus Caldarchaeum sp.]|uniref:Dihydropyrimidinase n=1 Tax=Caldiarchaeum subterraneum TaxID=311458 RepID=A0A7J3VTC0_CALS0
MDLVVKNCKLVDLTGIYEACVGVEKGVVVKIAKNIDEKADLTYDAKGSLLMPGVIDGHVHFNLKYGANTYTADDFESGTTAAACGGVTTIIDFVSPETNNYVEEFSRRKAEAEQGSHVDFGLHMIVVDSGAERLKQLEQLLADGVCSVKIFTAYSRRGLMLDDGAILRLMRFCSAKNMLVLSHCENEHVINYLVEEFLSEGKVEPIYHSLSRPDYVEAEAVERIALMSQVSGCESLVVHVSSKLGVWKIAEARKAGVRIHAETCPHYLMFTEDVYRRKDGARFIMSPPLKREEDRQGLWDALAKGYVSTVGSDHACYNSAEKLRHSRFVDVPGGVAGTEVIAMILFSEGVSKRRIGIDRMVETTALNPAKLYGLYPRKGVVMVGSDADFYILNPRKKTKLTRENLHSRIDHSIYEDVEVSCSVEATFSRGEMIVENGQVLSKPGRGMYLRRMRTLW